MRLYHELADWYPLLSPRDDYAEEAEELWRLILEQCGGPPARVLELGCGAGHLASFLRDRVALTLTDVAPRMLELARAVNPGVPTHLGDMRALRLSERFDLVYVHDAVQYMSTRDDLIAALRTARAHADRVIVLPDYVKETFEPVTDHDGHDAPDGRAFRYMEWLRRDGPDRFVVHYTGVCVHADGRVEPFYDRHVEGLFSVDEWRGAMHEAGWDVVRVESDPWRACVFVGEARSEGRGHHEDDGASQV